jgi:hemerythrin-like domain-containing protein
MNNQLVSDADVEKALDFLRDSADDIGHAKAEEIRTKRMTKHIIAIEMQRHNGMPVSAQEREAFASDAFNVALLAEAKAAGEFERLKALREAAAMKIECWRSMSANYRAMKIG